MTEPTCPECGAKYPELPHMAWCTNENSFNWPDDSSHRAPESLASGPREFWLTPGREWQCDCIEEKPEPGLLHVIEKSAYDALAARVRELAVELAKDRKILQELVDAPIWEVQKERDALKSRLAEYADEFANSCKFAQDQENRICELKEKLAAAEAEVQRLTPLGKSRGDEILAAALEDHYLLKQNAELLGLLQRAQEYIHQFACKTEGHDALCDAIHERLKETK